MEEMEDQNYLGMLALMVFQDKFLEEEVEVLDEMAEGQPLEVLEEMVKLELPIPYPLITELNLSQQI